MSRYELHEELASGGMATVYYGRLVGSHGFARTVAIKRVHAHLAKDPEFVSMFLEEVRLAARVRHPNVVATLDVVSEGGESLLVMEHVLGVSLSQLMRTARADGDAIGPSLAAGVMSGVLHGLHAAHGATSERGEALHLVHRDVSPQNILVGAEGVPRLLDFGVAKAVGRHLQSTAEGRLKGKISYMSPEQLLGEELDRRSDIYAAGVVLWELLVGRGFVGDGKDAVVALREALQRKATPPSAVVSGVPPELDDVVMRALARDPQRRFATAQQMALALEASVRVATPSEIAAWARELAGTVLRQREQLVATIEGGRSPVRRMLESLAEIETPSSRPVAAPSAAPPRRGRHRVAAAAALGVLGLALAVRGALHLRSAPSGNALGAVPSGMAPSREGAASSEPAASNAASAVLARSPAPVGLPSSSAAASPPGTPRPDTTGARRTRAVRPPASRPDGGCRVEQYVDGEGFTRFRCAP